MLAYAGLQLAELCWLLRTDVVFDEKRGRIWIGPVIDPTDSKSVHLLKTGNRERHVDIHPTYLLPLVREYLANSLIGEVFFFPKPNYTRNRKRILPKGITGASLRHTFGSLLLRSGKPYAQIAAAMGNTESVVMAHYARLRRHEVDIDF